MLSAYEFLIYRLIITYKNIGHIIDKKILFIIIAVIGLFLIYILNLTLNLTEVSSFKGLALMILIGIKDEKHHFISWICDLVGLLAIVVGDRWFAIIVLTSFVVQLWISSLLLSAHYLLIAGGIIGYLKYFVKWQSKDLIYRILTRTRKSISKKNLLGSLTLIILLIIFGPYSTNVFSNNENKYFINNGNFLSTSTH